MKIKVLSVFLLFLLLFVMSSCSEKETYGSPSQHLCINCGEQAESYFNKMWDSSGNLVDVYLCNDCEDEYLQDVSVVNHDVNGRDYPWAE